MARVRSRSPLVLLAVPLLVIGVVGATTAAASGGASPGVGAVPQGLQQNQAYADSNNSVTNVFATTQRTSCYRPENPFEVNLGPAEYYSGMSACPGATTGENVGATPYATQVGSNPGYPANGPKLVKDHAESDLRVDPTNAKHLIGSSKWIVSAEGYNHLLGFYESFDGGTTWPVQGHIPGYEGWTDNTDPIGAFDGYGNYYSLLLPYQFFYTPGGGHGFSVGAAREPNPIVPAEAIAVAVRPAGSTTAQQWVATHNGTPDYVATYDSKGNEPDKQWLAIDTNPTSPHFNRVYAMWVNFHGPTAVPYVSYADALPGGQHTDWSTPAKLPLGSHHPQGGTYLLPHVDGDGVLSTTITELPPSHQYAGGTILFTKSTDGGQTFSAPTTVTSTIAAPPLTYQNTTFRDGIESTYTVGRGKPVGGQYPLFAAWEDYSAGVVNVLLSRSADGGVTWSRPIQVNDNLTAVDEFQPNLDALPNGDVSVAWYDRRLACPTRGAEAQAAGLPGDTVNPKYPSLPPYGATNYCVNASIQFYSAALAPKGHNIRLTKHSWDPQLNAPHPSTPSSPTAFIGDYFGNNSVGDTSFTSFVSTYDDGSNPEHRQQQVVARVREPTS